MKVPKCPKCGKYPDYLTQFMEEKMDCEVSPNGFIACNPEDPYDAYPIRVTATCLCGYEWRLRGVESARKFDKGDLEWFKLPYN